MPSVEGIFLGLEDTSRPRSQANRPIGAYSKGRVPAYCQHYQWSIERGAGVAPSSFGETSAGRQSFDLCYHQSGQGFLGVFPNGVQGLQIGKPAEVRGGTNRESGRPKGAQSSPCVHSTGRLGLFALRICGAMHSRPTVAVNQNGNDYIRLLNPSSRLRLR